MSNSLRQRIVSVTSFYIQPRWVAILSSILVCVLMIWSLSVDQSYLRKVVPFRYGWAESALPSAWFCDVGFTRFFPDDGWKITYDVPLAISQGRYSCDTVVESATGPKYCQSNMDILKNLVRHLEIHATYLSKVNDVTVEVDPGEFATLQDSLDATYRELSDLAGKRILIIGDSIDRNWLNDLAALMPPPYSRHCTDRLLSETVVMDKIYGSKVCIYPIVSKLQHIPVATQLQINDLTTYGSRQDIGPGEYLHLDFLFSFGILDQLAASIAEWVPSLSPPFRLSDRIEVVKEWWGCDVDNARPNRYDAIFLNSGYWDIKALHDSRDPRWLINGGLSTEAIELYETQFRDLVHRLKSMYGSSIPMYLRLVHDIHHRTDMSAIAVRDLRTAQIAIARTLDLHIHPFAHRMEGRDLSYQYDEIHPGPVGNMINMELFLRFVREIR